MEIRPIPCCDMPSTDGRHHQLLDEGGRGHPAPRQCGPQAQKDGDRGEEEREVHGGCVQGWLRDRKTTSASNQDTEEQWEEGGQVLGHSEERDAEGREHSPRHDGELWHVEASEGVPCHRYHQHGVSYYGMFGPTCNSLSTHIEVRSLVVSIGPQVRRCL